MIDVPGWVLLQMLDPSALVGLPAWVRASTVFVVVLVVGGAFLWRHDGIVERSIRASIDRPLASLGYGVAAHLTIVFFSVYLASQLGRIAPSGWSLSLMGTWLGVIVLAVIGGLGFTVVGEAIVELRWGRQRVYGLLLGAVMAALAALSDPLLGGILWLIVVSMGIGGPVRSWFHAAEDVSAMH